MAVNRFDASDVELSTSTAGDIGSFTVTVGKVAPSTYTVTVNWVTTGDDVNATIPAGRVSDLAGNLNEVYAGTINITGHTQFDFGNLSSIITLSGVGVPANTPALKSLKVHGMGTGITIKVASGTGTVGDIGSISLNS